MSAEIVPFPFHDRQKKVMADRNQKKVQSPKSEKLIKTTMEGHMICMALNVYGKQHWPGMSLAVPSNIMTFPQNFIIDCLTDACNSNLIAEEGKNIFRTILWRLQPAKV